MFHKVRNDKQFKKIKTGKKKSYQKSKLMYAQPPVEHKDKIISFIIK